MSDVPTSTGGQLWQRLIEATARATQTGRLEPIPTVHHPLARDGVEWLVRMVDATRKTPRAAERSDHHNPFLPYDPVMYVADLSATHVCLLNRFNVVDHHLLIITRHFESQESPLTLADFQALWTCLREYDSLGFYNSGPRAGASQPHKHLQTVPLPLRPEDPVTVPLLPRFDFESLAFDQVNQSPQLPFVHFLSRWQPEAKPNPEQAAAKSYALYRQMISAAGWQEISAETPYNLLVARDWMLFVPRRQEHFEQTSLNALAFAGALLVKDDEQLDKLRRVGPLQALRHVAQAR